MSDEKVGLGSCNRNDEDLVEGVIRCFVELLIAGGTSLEVIKSATSRALVRSPDAKPAVIFEQLGGIQRDCMEVMCAWRREREFVDQCGNPAPLLRDDGDASFEALCQKAGCRSPAPAVLKTLLDFGAVSIDGDQRVVAETPTFLLGHAHAGGRIAVDGVLKQLEGFLRVVHRNICSVSGERKPRFERACTVSVAAELEPIFDQLVRNRGQIFIDSVDEWLARNSKSTSATGRYMELGAGVYFIELRARGNGTDDN